MGWKPPADPAGDVAAAAVLAHLAGQVREAAAAGTPLAITGGGTKTFLLGAPTGAPLAMGAYRGVIAYAPAELVIELRAGTPLSDVEALLAAHGQVLACEPPRFGPATTIGGAISAGLSGPARPYAGAVRDHVLGIGLLSPAGELLRFGGRVMKNVAGYDISRLVTGAWGSLGPIATLALRVAPRPACSAALSWAMNADEALHRMNELARATWPVSGAAHDGECLRIRLAGSTAAVDEAVARLAPEQLDADDAWWQALRDLRLPGLRGGGPFWRISVPPAAVIAGTPRAQIIDWGGAQRWWSTDSIPAATLHAMVRKAVGGQGHAVPMFAASPAEHPPLSTVQRRLEARIRAAFDPQGLFNRGCSRVAC